MKDVKAVLFDTFGTVVDWRGGVTRQGERLAKSKGIEGVDWEAFARAWRAGYRPGMEAVISGKRPWTAIDVIHRERLEEILPDFGLSGTFSDSEKAEMNLFWHRLDPWPDSIPGLTRLKSRYLISPLSNGSLPLLANMSKRAGLPWDFLFFSDMSEAYKPDPKVYTEACRLLALEPGQVMMAAAHNYDLDAARELGMKTAYINRPYEYGVDQKKDFEATSDWDCIGDTIEEIAEQMGC